MYYRSRYKKLQIVMKPARRIMVDNEMTNLPAHRIQFNNGLYVPKDKDEEKFLDDLASKIKVRYWKVTDEDIKLAKEYSDEIKQVNAKFKDKKDHIDRVKKPAKKYQVKRGVSTTENSDGTKVETEKKHENKPIKKSKKKKDEPESKDNADNSSEFQEE